MLLQLFFSFGDPLAIGNHFTIYSLLLTSEDGKAEAHTSVVNKDQKGEMTCSRPLHRHIRGARTKTSVHTRLASCLLHKDTQTSSPPIRWPSQFPTSFPDQKSHPERAGWARFRMGGLMLAGALSLPTCVGKYPEQTLSPQMFITWNSSDLHLIRKGLWMSYAQSSLSLKKKTFGSFMSFSRFLRDNFNHVLSLDSTQERQASGKIQQLLFFSWT